MGDDRALRGGEHRLKAEATSLVEGPPGHRTISLDLEDLFG
jgi:hypothetical protein